MLQAVDGHQAFYYFFMHIWHAIFPITEFTTRLPSLIAVGLAAAGVVVLGKQISTKTVAITAGVVFALLPRVTATLDARPYAITMAIAVWLTIYCVTASRREERWRWPVYAVLLALATVFNLHLFLIAPAHAVAVRQFASTPGAFRKWALATAGALAVLVPYVMLAKSKFPGAWIPPLSWNTASKVFEDQYFGAEHKVDPTAVSLLAGAILIAGLVIGLRSGARRPTGLVALALTWVAVPTLCLLALSIIDPIYVPRYLSFTAPGLALLLGLCITKIGRNQVGIVVVLALFAVAAAPVYLAQRNKRPVGQDYKQAAEVINRYAAPGDCLLIADSGFDYWSPKQRRWPPLRSMLIPEPSAYVKLVDPGLIPSTGFFNGTKPVADWADQLAGCPAIWTLTDRDNTLPNYQKGQALPVGPRLQDSDSYKLPSQLGFRVVERWQSKSGLTQVTKSTR